MRFAKLIIYIVFSVGVISAPNGNLLISYWNLQLYDIFGQNNVKFTVCVIIIFSQFRFKSDLHDKYRFSKCFFSKNYYLLSKKHDERHRSRCFNAIQMRERERQLRETKT